MPVLGTGGSGGTTALTGGAPGQTGGAPGQTGGAVGTGGAAGEPGGPRGGATATGGRAAPSGGAGGMGAAGAPGSPGGAGTDPGNAGDGDFVIMPPYASAVKVTNVPHSTKFSMQTSASKVYPGAARPIVVYIHKQYVDGTEAPFIIITDGNAPAAGSPEIVTAAENHYQDTDPATRIPPQVFIFVPPGANRSVEYDTVSDAYSRFINTEVLPLVESNADIKAVYPNFKLTTNPDGRAAYGCSSGSPAAMGLAWFSNFHRVVSYSGTFVALQATADHPLGAWEYPAMILAAPPKPLRVFLEVGEMDNGYTTTEAGHHNWVIGNRNMAAALKTQGYHYRFLFAMGAGHCDGSVKSKTYSETLSWVWRGYAAN
ncbi:MAG: alpha/beta hydrolase-fold protein [Pseudomonadota bacterium]